MTMPQPDARTRYRLLLVEDQPIIGMAQAQSIRGFGYEVEHVATGEAAVERALAEPRIHLVLMDIDLGSGIDGTQAATRILRGCDLPIVFLTSHGEREIVERVKGITSYGYVLKGSGDFVLHQAIESALRLFHSHQAYRHVFDNSPTGLCVRELVGDEASGTTDFLCLEANDAFFANTGLERDRVIGHTLREIYPDDPHVDSLIQAYAGVVQSGESYTAEIYFEPLSRWLRVRAYPSVEQRLTVAVTNVTDEVETRARLEQREHDYRGLFEDHSLAKLIIDRETGEIVDANRAAVDYYGWTRDELRGMPISAINRLSDAEVEEAMEEFTEGVSDGMLLRHARADGLVRDVRVYSAPVEVDGRSCLHSVVLDVTAREETRRRLEEAEAEARSLLERNRLLMRDILHRVKNDTAFLRSLLGLQSEHAPDAASRAVLREASRRIGVMSRLYDRLYTEGEYTRVHARPFVEDLVRDFQGGALPPGVRVELSVDDVVLPTRQALSLALIASEAARNAVKHALGSDSALTVRFACGVPTAGRCTLRVADTGAGFPDEVLAGGASGLGLTIIEALAAQHHGSVRLMNEGGAVVEVEMAIDSADGPGGTHPGG